MDIPPDNTMTFYTVILAGLSAIAGMIAAIAAWRSSSAAKNLIVAQAAAEKRRLTLNVARLLQEITSKAESLNRLCDEVKLKYDSLAVFSGSSGSSWHKILKDRIESSRTRITQIIDEVEKAHPTEELIDNMDEKHIGQLLITYTMKREELIELASALSIEKSEIHSQLAIYQEKAIG